MIKKLGVSAFLLLVSINAFAGTSIPKSLLDEINAQASLKAGEVLYIDFWASWCNPCRKSFPWMNSMVEKYQSQGFKVLAINVDKDQALAENFLNIVNPVFPILYDPKGKFAKQFKVKGMPSSFVIDAKGNVLLAHKGFFEDQTDSYEGEIKLLLKNK